MNAELFTSVAAMAGNAATVLAVLVAMVGLFLQGRWTQRSNGAEVFVQLEEKFYHGELMRDLRRNAALELQAKGGGAQGYRAFQDLADFFEFVGVLNRRGILDAEMAWSSFYRRAAMFWHFADKKNVIEMLTCNQELRWEEYRKMVDRLSSVHRKHSAGKGKMGVEELNELLKSEAELPVLVGGQEKIG